MGNCQNCLHTESENLEVSLHTEESPHHEEPLVPQLYIEVKTWQKESYSLYDYENNQFVATQNLTIQHDGYVLLKQSRVQFKEGQYTRVSDETLLLPLELEQETFQLINYRFMKRCYSSEALQEEYQKDDVDKLLSENQTVNADFHRESIQKMKTATNRHNFAQIGKGPKIWLVARSLQENSLRDGLKLQVGDVLKLGRVKLVVKKIQLDLEQSIIEDDEPSIVSDDNNGGRQCRVCLSTGESKVNPLVDPCKCSGSTKYIHLKCLMTWLQQRAHSKCNNYCTVFIWRNLECEICKAVYPPQFTRDEQSFDLIELSKPKGKPYMLLEYIPKKQQQEAEGEGNGLYIINFGSKKELRVGRNHEVEISINDISVSRTHAVLKLVNNDVLLQDNKSKFGTLLLLQNNVNFVPALSGLEIQVKRSLFNFNSNYANSNLGQQRDFEQLLGRNY